MNISFEPESGNPGFETPDFFQFSVNLVLSKCWFYHMVLYKPQQRNLEFWTYFSVISFLCLATKEDFQTQQFKSRVLNQPDFENPKKIHFKPEKGHFWFTLKGPILLPPGFSNLPTTLILEIKNKIQRHKLNFNNLLFYFL